jgi:ABC-type antimicrobial peptide transport system permease subunit
VLVGVVVGLGGALTLAPSLGALLFGVGPADPRTFVTTAAALVGIALLAALVPARRAMRVNPIVALRGE